MPDYEACKMLIGTILNTIVPAYDPAQSGCFARLGWRLLALPGGDPGQRVVDEAAGSGAMPFPAPERVGENGEAVGLESPTMRRSANSWLPGPAGWVPSSSTSRIPFRPSTDRLWHHVLPNLR